MLLFVGSVVTRAVPKSSHFGMTTTTIYDFVTRLCPIMIITLAKNAPIGNNNTPVPHLTRRKQSTFNFLPFSFLVIFEKTIPSE